MLIAYTDQKFQRKTMLIIEQANEILAEYERLRLQMNLRQLYYQFVSRGLLANNQQNYKKLGSIINDARMAGLVSWNAIEDLTRNLTGRPAWPSAKGFLESVVPQFHVPMWENQPTRLEVWVEKRALLGTISAVCREWDVPYIACNGYMSQSEEWQAGRRILSYRDDGQDTIIVYLGDHDPSGLDMSRDHVDRLSLFAEAPVEVRRVALNWDQVQRYNPPPNPTKMEDSRADGYISRYGMECWELDALNPRVIAQLVREEIERVVDPVLWEVRRRFEATERRKLYGIELPG